MLKRLLSISWLLAVLLCASACSGSSLEQINRNIAETPVTGQTTHTSVVIAEGHFQEYALPQANSGLMRPAIDHEGRVWFGEMGHNYLAFFDPRTRTFTQMTPPQGASGIMGIAVAADDTIWFAEQYANYIGHYFPHSGQYKLYSLPVLKTVDPNDKNSTISLPSAPNDIAFDAQGNVWFTELNADSIGMLDPHTGQIKQFPLSPKKTIQTLNPYGIAIDPEGIVWFTEVGSNHIGSLDPHTGAIRLYTLQDSANPFMEIRSDSHGAIWATSFNAGLLVKLDPRTGTLTPYYAPNTGSNTGGLYGLLITSSNEVWVTVTSSNVLARLDSSTKRFIYYQIPTAASTPFGLVMGPEHTIWFTEAGSNKIGMLKP
ncbi:hypothetical protein EPA93_19515 [Ktedonosporobacter rubrisoli]|uniref:SMP-30/Gluconolactonase/LRE-like region domain-containing protein n=1 Tax=Ktedonosporobacter rubrisoli TaxID=2509675 RepID=A0A4P6JRS5_KTERU|nr:hypothetical protein [Ktedonosporobacter rubrisoli]QBD78064.1 hypothetical protein EPA93_19515 [Ktedonosporobacter rubrisoli]